MGVARTAVRTARCGVSVAAVKRDDAVRLFDLLVAEFPSCQGRAGGPASLRPPWKAYALCPAPEQGAADDREGSPPGLPLFTSRHETSVTDHLQRRYLSDEREAILAEGFVHTVYKDTVEGEDQSLPSTHETKEAAVAAGRKEAMRRKTEHVIHNEDGTIGERNPYGGDPADRPG
jgi:hypothetical protein